MGKYTRTMAESLSSKTSAMLIRTKAQNRLISLEKLKFDTYYTSHNLFLYFREKIKPRASVLRK